MDLPLAPLLGETFSPFLGQTFTPEVAARIASMLLIRCYPGRVDTSAVEPKRVGSYTLRCAPVAEVLDGLREIHRQHWEETEGYRHEVPFNPDYERGLDLERQGRYLLVVAEHETAGVVGNYGLYLAKSMHTQRLIATEDTLFLAKPHRRGRIGVELMKYAEYALAQVGASEFSVDVKLTNNVGRMLVRMGFVPCGQRYIKVLRGSPDVLT